MQVDRPLENMYPSRRYSVRESAHYPSSVLYEHNNNHSYSNLSHFLNNSKNHHSFHSLNNASSSSLNAHPRHPYALSTSRSSSAMLRSCSNFIHRFSSRLKLQNNESGSGTFAPIREEKQDRAKEQEKENVRKDSDSGLLSPILLPATVDVNEIPSPSLDPPVASARKHLHKVPFLFPSFRLFPRVSRSLNLAPSPLLTPPFIHRVACPRKTTKTGT